MKEVLGILLGFFSLLITNENHKDKRSPENNLPTNYEKSQYLFTWQASD